MTDSNSTRNEEGRITQDDIELLRTCIYGRALDRRLDIMKNEEIMACEYILEETRENFRSMNKVYRAEIEKLDALAQKILFVTSLCRPPISTASDRDLLAKEWRHGNTSTGPDDYLADKAFKAGWDAALETHPPLFTARVLVPKLQDENKRLREALERIAGSDVDTRHGFVKRWAREAQMEQVRK